MSGGNKTPELCRSPPKKGGTWREASSDWADQWDSFFSLPNLGSFFFFHYNSLCFHVNWARHAKAEEATPEEPLSHGDHIEEDLWLTRLVWTVGSAFAKRGWTLFPCSLREITARHASSHWAAWPHSHRHGSNAHTGESEPCHCQHALPDWLSVKLLSGLCNCFVFYRK